MSTSLLAFNARFFVLRTPLLPASGGLGTRPMSPGGSLHDPFIREALWLASPEFAQTEERAGEGEAETKGAAEKKARAARSRYRYLSRMAYRATPFGLFAGITLGETGRETRFELAGPERYERKTRLDFEYLHEVVAALLQSPEARRALAFRVNSSLFETSEGFLYAESRFDGKRRGLRSGHPGNPAKRGRPGSFFAPVMPGPGLAPLARISACPAFFFRFGKDSGLPPVAR